MPKTDESQKHQHTMSQTELTQLGLYNCKECQKTSEMQVKFLEHEIASYIVFQKIILMVSAESDAILF